MRIQEQTRWISEEFARWKINKPHCTYTILPTYGHVIGDSMVTSTWKLFSTIETRSVVDTFQHAAQ